MSLLVAPGKAAKDRRGESSSNGVQRGVPDHPRANTSVQERKAPEQHPQHGVEGRAPHRAEAFVAMRKSEDRKLDVTTGRRKIQPDTRRT